MTESTRRRVFHIVDALNEEWDVLASNSTEKVAMWAAKHKVLEPCRGLGDVLLAIRHEPDATLSALLTEVTSNDQLAARAILQATLGKLVRMAAVDRYSGVDDYVSAMWCQIRTYPLKTRPHRIVANLVLDTLKQVVGERQHLPRRAVILWPPNGQLDQIYDDAMRENLLDHQSQISGLTAEQVLDSAAQLGLLDMQMKELLNTVYADGITGQAAAVLHGMSPGAVRVRCCRAVKQLVRHRAELLEAA